MKRLFYMLAFLLFAGRCFAAGGACPTGAYYINPSNATGPLVTLSSLGVTSCYFSAANGLDTNNGTTEATPFLHAPGMTNCTNTCAGVSIGAGIGLIFRGADVWHFGNTGASPSVGSKTWTFANAGTLANPDYIGVDPTWFAGTYFTGPIFSGDNAITNSQPASCTYDFNNINSVVLGAGGYVMIDDIEASGFCASETSDPNAGIFSFDGTHAVAERLYCHGFMISSSAVYDEQVCIHGRGNAYRGDLTNQCLFNVFDNSDGSLGNVGTYPSGSASMEAIQTACGVVGYSVFNRISNGIVGTTTSVHDSLFHDMYEPVGSVHGNIWNVDNDALASFGSQSFINNIVYNINEGVGVWFMPNTVGYYANNVQWNISNSSNCVMIGGSSQATGLPVTTMYVYNNTHDSPCNIRALNNGSDPKWVGTTHFGNNHFIGFSPASLSSTYSADSGTTPTWTDDSSASEKFQTEAVANAQGYLPANHYAPVSSSVITVGAGVNPSAICATIPMLCSGTSGGVLEVTGAGRKWAVYPAIIVKPRQPTGAVDSGAYQSVYGVVGNTLFGQGFNKTSSPWCPIDGNSVDAQIYRLRVWDSGMKLSQIFPSNLTPTWTSLDTQINTRALSGGCPGTPMQIIYTFGDVPQWASNCSGCTNPSTSLPGAVGSGFGGGTGCSGTSVYSCMPFSDVNADGTGTDATLMSMAVQIVARYAGKITYYEAWNEEDSPQFSCYQGTPVLCGPGNPNTTANVAENSRAVRMAWDLYNAEKCLDPLSKAMSPSFHVGTALTWFHYFNTTSISAPALTPGTNNYPSQCPAIAAQTVTGSMTYDYVNVHARGGSTPYPASGGNWNPANFVPAIVNTKTEIANDVLPNPTIIFNDEFGYNSALEGGTVTTNFSAFVAQDYLFCISYGMAGCDWYQWDTTTIGLSQALQGSAYDTVVGLTAGQTSTSLCSLSGNVYKCVMSNGVWAWDISTYSSTTCCTYNNNAFGATYTNYIDLTNTSHPTTGGNGTVPLGWQPVLVQSSGTPPSAPTNVQGIVAINGNTKVF